MTQTEALRLAAECREQAAALEGIDRYPNKDTYAGLIELAARYEAAA